MLNTDIDNLFNDLDKLENFPISKKKLTVMMDADTAVAIHKYAQECDDTESQGFEGFEDEDVYRAYVAEHIFKVQGVVCRVICDSGIGWFLGIL